MTNASGFIVSQAEAQRLRQLQHRFISGYYKQLDSTIRSNCYGFGSNSEEFAAEVWIKLLPVIYRKAFVDDGLQTEIDCLKWFKTKAHWLAVESKTAFKKRTKDQLSYDKITEDLEDGGVAPSGWLNATIADFTLDEHLIRRQRMEKIRSFAQSDYEHALLDSLMGHRLKQDVADDFGVHVNTVTNNIKTLGERIRSGMILGDCL
jgi:hypothetical protein